MATLSANTPPDPAVAPLNFIYACAICCASLADVHESHGETVQGFSDGINPKERLVTRLFLASCCHVFCAAHLDGGGPPFHPAGQRPKAPCPVCAKEKGESTARDLYSVRGFGKDEYDPQIPSSWFTAPPIRLDGNGKEMDALRFQYLALIRYCQNTYAARKPIQDALSDTKQKLVSMQQLASEEHAKVLTLDQENEQLRNQQDQFDATKAELRRLHGLEEELDKYRRLHVNPHDLETFVANKTAIRHYLKLVPMLIEQNDKMKERLAQLGFAMALEPMPNFKGVDPHAFNRDDVCPDDCAGESGTLPRKTSSSQTAGRSAHTSRKLATVPSSPFPNRPLKRQRVDSPLPDRMQMDPPSSRDVMPPPSKSVSRMQSVRGIIPSLRKKFSHSRWTPVHEDDSSKRHDNRMFGIEHEQRGSDGRPSTRHGHRDKTPYMSGALPVENDADTMSVRDPRTILNVGTNGNTSDFTFRASSPIKLQTPPIRPSPVQLPTEPSYIRLMDGLSRNADFEVGLTDPRESSMKDYSDDFDDGQVMTSSEQRHQDHGVDRQGCWTFGHSVSHQPHMASASSMADDTACFNSFRQTNGTASRPHEPPLGRVTPATIRHQQPNHKFESVVSPFFDRSQHRAPLRSRAGFAETQDSSRRFGAYLLPRTPKIGSQAGWPEQRTLNGLSFFDSPVNIRNEPFEWNHQQGRTGLPPSSQHFRRQCRASRGFVQEPETGRSCFSRPSHSTQATMHSQTSNFFPPHYRSAYTHVGRPSSVMPTGSSPHTAAPVRQWEALHRKGVRSSRNTCGSLQASSHSRSTRDLASAFGRRSVRR